MIIFTRKGVLSITANRGGKSLVVSTQEFSTLNQLFPDANPLTVSPEGDWPFSAKFDRKEVAKVIAAEVEAVHYENMMRRVNPPWRVLMLSGILEAISVIRDRVALTNARSQYKLLRSRLEKIKARIGDLNR